MKIIQADEKWKNSESSKSENTQIRHTKETERHWCLSVGLMLVSEQTTVWRHINRLNIGALSSSSNLDLLSYKMKIRCINNVDVRYHKTETWIKEICNNHRTDVWRFTHTHTHTHTRKHARTHTHQSSFWRAERPHKYNHKKPHTHYNLCI